MITEYKQAGRTNPKYAVHKVSGDGDTDALYNWLNDLADLGYEMCSVVLSHDLVIMERGDPPVESPGPADTA